MVREKFKIIELQGRKWKVGRFDALTGSYIASLLLMQILPMGLEQKIGLKIPIATERSLMDKKTFMDLQVDCLRVCYEQKAVGETIVDMPILLEDGRWGVEEIGTNISLVVGLTIHALIFNISDFFQEETLNSLIKSFKDLDLSLFSVKE